MKKQKYIASKGAWIYIIKPTSIVDNFIPYMSVWYGIPTGNLSIGSERYIGGVNINDLKWEHNFNLDMDHLKLAIKTYFKNKKGLSVSEESAAKAVIDGYDIHQQMKILTPFGTVYIQPEEYNVVDINKYFEMLKDGSMQMKHMNTSINLSNTLRDKLFYIRSRGISLVEALKMISGNLNTQNAFFLLTNPYIQEMFLRDFDAENAKQLAFKEKMIKKNPDYIGYFFDEEEALKLNRQSYGETI